MLLKKMICGILAVSVVSAFSSAVLAEKDVISVLVDNEEVEFDQAPTIIDGRTLVPIRAVFEKAGAYVEWDQATKTATISNEVNEVKITANKDILLKNGKAVGIDVPAQVISDRMMIPVRAISDALDYGVTWNGYQSTVLIATNGRPYRAFAMVKRGFRDLVAASSFYVSGSCVDNLADLDGDGINETVSFTKASNTEEPEMPLLTINGVNFTSVIKKDFASTEALAVVKPDGQNTYVTVVGNGDLKTAHFYKYENGTLTDSGDNSVITFKSKLLFDEKVYVLSDLHGLCFTDIMITGSFYKYEDGEFNYYRLSNAESFAPNLLLHKYDDNMIFKQIITEKYSKGSYGAALSYELVSSESLKEFTLQEMYVDPKNPANVEFYVELANGTHAVLMPYQS